PTSYTESISIQEYPKYNPQEVYPEHEDKVEKLKGIISAVRSLRSDLRIEPSRKIKLYYRANESESLLGDLREHIMNLARLEELIKVEDKQISAISGFFKDFEFFIPLEEGIKVDELLSSYRKKYQEVVRSLENIDKKLKNENFLKRAPEEEVEKVKAIKEELTYEKDKTDILIKSLESLKASTIDS
ncbi:MAG: valine--tRNA ligase, partial [Aquificaceae bacterium]